MKLSRIFRDHTLKVININLKKINYKYNIVNNIGIDEIINNLNGINNIDIGEIIYNSLNDIKNNNDISKENDTNTNLGFYLAGLIEAGNGNIYICKNNKNASMITIAFNSKYFPLTLTIQKTLNCGGWGGGGKYI